MDTKLKGWTSLFAVKITSFVLVILMVVLSFVCLFNVIEKFEETRISPEIVFSGGSTESANQHFFNRNMQNIIYHTRVLATLQNEEYIRERRHITGLVYHWQVEEGRVEIDDRGLAHIEATSNEEWGRLERYAINIQLGMLNNAIFWLEEIEGLLFFVREDDFVRTNISASQQNRDFFMEHQLFFVVESGVAFNFDRDVSHISSGLSFSHGDDSEILLAFTDEVVDAHAALFVQAHAVYLRNFAIIAVAMIMMLVCIVILLLGAGRRKKAEGVHFLSIDKPYLDISFGLVVGWIIAVVLVLVAVTNININWAISSAVAVVATAVIIALIPVMLWFGSLAKQIKSGKFWRHSLCYFILIRLLRFVGKLFTNIWHSFPLAPKLFIRPFNYARDIYTLEKGAKAIENGQWDNKIYVSGGELKNIADSLNNIQDGIAIAVEERTKSERMKTELITGVSHDIRTPLTSIITYTDLLKQEGLDSQQAPEYLDVLVQKSARLKALTDDLFEAAKAASGNVEVNLVPLDLVALTSQVLGEMDGQLKSSGVQLRVNLPEQLYVMADGKLMWRVMENLLSNVCKYSLHGSRAYLNVVQEKKEAVVQLKNISSAELSLDPAELTERFKRGDQSRTDGGSGLGLSIVKSFVEAQKGRFTIAIDGDLFKSEVKLLVCRDK